MALLVILYCLTIGLTYDRAGFTYKSQRNYVQKYYAVSSQGVRTHPTHLLCLRHCYGDSQACEACSQRETWVEQRTPAAKRSNFRRLFEALTVCYYVLLEQLLYKSS